jgi:hypothetical protein
MRCGAKQLRDVDDALRAAGRVPVSQDDRGTVDGGLVLLVVKRGRPRVCVTVVSRPEAEQQRRLPHLALQVSRVASRHVVPCSVVAYLFGAGDGELDGRVELARYEAVSFEQGVSRAPYLLEASHISHELVYVRLVQPLVLCPCDFIVFTFFTFLFFSFFFRDAAQQVHAQFGATRESADETRRQQEWL